MRKNGICSRKLGFPFGCNPSSFVWVATAGTMGNMGISAIRTYIGLLNITDKEVTPFLMAGVVLVITSSLGVEVFGTVAILGNILTNMLTLFVPATIIVALKSVFSLAKSK